MVDEQTIEKRLICELARRYGVRPEEARVLFAPYRICPLGAHIDHQLGRVTAMALDQGVHLAYAPSGSSRVCLGSLAFPGEVEFNLDDVPDASSGDWGNYARGAARALAERHPLRSGIVGVTAGAVAEGGLSSSAAVGVAYLLALEDVNGLQISARENVALDQHIENRYLGLRNGILDQSAILLSRQDHLTVIDCATVEHELIPPPAAMSPPAILIVFSGLRKSLVATDYNRRVAECREAAEILLGAAGRPGEEPLLGRVSSAEYAAHSDRLSGPPARRAAHFFSEMDRVARGILAWQEGNLAELGRLITASGDSSIRNYECGALPLVNLYEILVATPGVYGARFSGAGFRGCCVALVEQRAALDAAESARSAYAARHPELARAARTMICRSADGARILLNQ